MKKCFALFLIIVLLVSAVPVSAAYTGGMLSPALAVISEEYNMVKSGLISGDIVFSEEDFTKAVGAEVDSITVTSLPLSSDGVLMYNGCEVVANQTISSGGLSALKFVPRGNTKTGSFRFKACGEYTTECILRYTDTVNLAPSAALSEDDIAVWTQCDITYCGNLAGSDPEGDGISFEVVKQPEKGVVNLNDKIGGGYTYTPCDGMTGKDTFTYVVRDEWGHYSDEATVIVTVDKAACELVFADMDGHWAHNAALVMASENAMNLRSDGDIIYFDADEMITREEFVVAVMKILGAGEIEPKATVFADNDEITESASGYISRAYSLDIIKGIEKDGKMYFEPTGTISRADAAVVLNKIIGIDEPDTYPVFADGDSVPVYARGSLYALSANGIFHGNGEGFISPNSSLSRGEAAQILLNVLKLYR